MRKKLSAFSAMILVAISTGAVAQTQQPTNPEYYWPGPWHMQMWGGGYGWPMWWMFPMMLLFFLAVCAAVFFFARGMCGMSHWGPPSRTAGDPTQSALQILNERFARGEIQKEEYGDRKTAILKG